MIGIFDSGLGGLTVVKAIQKHLPQYQIMYLGDTARVPYGNRSAEAVYQFTLQGVNYLFQNGCKLVVVACNTASAEALRRIQHEYLPKNHPERGVLGVIRPLVERAAKMTKNKKVGVIGTRGTIASGAYIRELHSQNQDIEVFQNAAPLLVPLTEEGWTQRHETRKILKYYLKPLKEKNIDTLILGCTHYPIIFSLFQQLAGRSCRVLDSENIIADSLENYLHRRPEIERELEKGSRHRYCVTDSTPVFSSNAQKWLEQKIVLEKVNLEE